ncbi:helix-turn-helix domain-containing protein [Seohaeicola zhoushanensis]|nr:helix-turn-helix transcriptional regulator [Seohaeicola zhoushanensis]
MTNVDYLCALAYTNHMNDLARTPRQIGAIIQRARKKRDWTQMKLAERAGLRQATISMIESGEKPAKLETILAILAALDLEFRIGERSKGHGSDIEELF